MFTQQYNPIVQLYKLYKFVNYTNEIMKIKINACGSNTDLKYPSNTL